MLNRNLLTLIPLLLAGLLLAETADAQSIFERARRAAERGAERAVEREAERRAERAVTGAIECVAGDSACVEEARAEGQDVTIVDQQGNPVDEPQPQAAPQPQPAAAPQPVPTPQPATQPTPAAEPVRPAPSGVNAASIVDRVHQTYVSMMQGVDSYLVITEMMGFEQQAYHQRSGPLEYTTYVRIPGMTDWTTGEEEATAGIAIPTEEAFQRLRADARLIGEQNIDGRRAYLIQTDNPGALLNEDQLPGDQEMVLDQVTLYVDADSYLVLGFDGNGTIQADGRNMPLAMTMRSSDFRTVDGMTLAFLNTMSVDGVMDGLSDEERAQMEEARRQMEQMPPEQRQMMERMMGDQLAQFEQMADGGAMEMQIRVKDLQVNVPRPD